MRTTQRYSKLLLLVFICSSYLWGYSFSMEIDKSSPLLGEKNILTLHFIYDNLEEYEIEEPHFQHFHIKPTEDKEFQDDNGTWHAILRYEFTAQKTGTFTLNPLKAHIEILAPKYQTLYNKNKYLQKLDIHTKPITLTVMPIPGGLNVIGNYKLFANVDKTKVVAGKPVEFTVTLKGDGNIKNLDFITLNIPNVMVYKKSTHTHEKSFTLISERNFTIPPLSLKYFNQETEDVSYLSTNAYFIGMDSPTQPSTRQSSFLPYLLVVTFILLLLWFTFNTFENIAYTDKKTYFKRQLSKIKNKEALLKKVAPYLTQNRQLTRLIYTLEEVEDSKFKKLKKEILKYL